MKLNLIFKRVHEDSVEMVMVPVDIPQLNKEDRWTLASSCDTFTKFEVPADPIVVTGKPLEVVEEIAEVNDTTVKDESKKDEKTLKSAAVSAGGKYESQVRGTARLVRYKDKIRITYRKGKTTFNKNEPNSVCIDDITKQQFFNAVKRQYGTDVVVWQLVLGDTEYEHYNQLIDRLYEEGRISYNKLLVVSG